VRYQTIKRDGNFFITLLVAFPRAKANGGSKCQRIGTSVNQAVLLSGRLADGKLYDDSFDPPRQRLPRDVCRTGPTPATPSSCRRR
jgi:hypothetical protein